MHTGVGRHRERDFVGIVVGEYGVNGDVSSFGSKMQSKGVKKAMVITSGQGISGGCGQPPSSTEEGIGGPQFGLIQ